MTFDEFRDEAIRLLREEDPKDSVVCEYEQWMHAHAGELSQPRWRIFSCINNVHWYGEDPREVLRRLAVYLEARRQQRLIDTPDYRRQVAEAFGLCEVQSD